MRLRGRRRRWLRLGLTPLIDVVFLLLLFFMLSSTFLNLQQMKIGMQAAAAMTRGNGKAVVVRVEATGLSIGEKPIPPGRLLPTLETLTGGDKKRHILVRTGDDIRLQRIVDVLEEIDSGGFTSLALRGER